MKNGATADSRKERQRWAGVLVFGTVALGCGLVELAGESGRLLLRYERGAVEAGEWWRAVTASFVHLGWSHLMLNLGGLALIWLLAGRLLPARDWFAAFAVPVLAVGLGLWIFSPSVVWYVGLSGALHGLLIVGAGAMAGARHPEGWILVIVLAVKVSWEQLVGPMPFSEVGAGGPVLVDAHFYGAVGGALLFYPARRRAFKRLEMSGNGG